MKRSLLVILLLCFVAGGAWANNFYFIYCIGNTNGNNCVIYSDILEVRNGTNEQGILNQFSEWLGAYSLRLTGFQDFTFISPGLLGPYEKYSEARSVKLGEIADSQYRKHKVYDLAEKYGIPTFKYIPD